MARRSSQNALIGSKVSARRTSFIMRRGPQLVPTTSPSVWWIAWIVAPFLVKVKRPKPRFLLATRVSSPSSESQQPFLPRHALPTSSENDLVSGRLE